MTSIHVSRTPPSQPVSIQGLPIELLQKIFRSLVYRTTLRELLIDSDPASGLECDRLTISQVCSWWRLAALADSKLWALIMCPMTRGAMNWIRVCLLRSRGAELLVRVAAPCNIMGSRWTHTLHSFLGALEEEGARFCGIIVLFRTTSDGHKLGVHVINMLRSTEARPQMIVLRNCVVPFAAGVAKRGSIMSDVEELEFADRNLHREALYETLRLSPNLNEIILDLNSYNLQYCFTGQAISPQIRLPSITSLELRHCALPALSFVSPGLLHLKVTFSEDRARSLWWDTAYYPIPALSHHEVIHTSHFPLLQTLSVNATLNNPDFLEPQTVLIRAHPDISTLWICGERGAKYLLQRAFGKLPLILDVSDSASSGDRLAGIFLPSSPPPRLRKLILDFRHLRNTPNPDKTESDDFIPLSHCEFARHFLSQSKHLHIRFILAPFSCELETELEESRIARQKFGAEIAELGTEFPGRCSLELRHRNASLKWCP